MTADLDTLVRSGYAPGGEFLPAAPGGGRAAGADGQGADAFARSRELFDARVEWLAGGEAAGLEHGGLEARLETGARELFCQLLQDHLDLRAASEARIDVVAGSDGARRGRVERGHRRPLLSVFGAVAVSRMAYRRRGAENLCPADAALNLAVEAHSHGLRRLAAIESSRGSFDDAAAAVQRCCGQRLGKRQAEQLAQRAAVDFDGFYAQRRPPAADCADVLVLSCDGKGVVMRADALREPTRKAAQASENKLNTRLSKGEKRNRKRIAEVGAVYDAAPVPRARADILPASDAERKAALEGPAATAKWLTASVIDDAATVVAQVFDEAERRDPGHARRWVALVDGNNHQINRIKAEARTRGIDIAIVCDLVHVIEYLWKGAWSFHEEGDPAAEAWVRQQLIAILDGRAAKVAGNIRRGATSAGLDAARRIGADTCAKYLTNKHKAGLLDYPTALKNGWPIATGVIEGACRHLVKDRMDITGARWGLPGAEAILKLRAIIANADFDEYWRYHLAQEHDRVHKSRYANHAIPQHTTT